jgi:hypothetical protein
MRSRRNERFGDVPKVSTDLEYQRDRKALSPMSVRWPPGEPARMFATLVIMGRSARSAA